MTFYYDPTLEYHHMAPVAVGGLMPAFYLAPQQGDDARRLFEAATRQLGLGASGPELTPPGPRMTGLTMALAREFGEAGLADALREAADRLYEPTWDRERGEFTWGFGLGEPHPRGQYNAAMAAGEAMSPGAWTRLFNDVHRERFDEPTVVGVDFPTVALRQAWWDRERGQLDITTSPKNEAVVGGPTAFRVQNLDPAVEWAVEIDGARLPSRGPEDELRIEMTVGRHRVAVFPADRAT